MNWCKVISPSTSFPRYDRPEPLANLLAHSHLVGILAARSMLMGEYPELARALALEV